MGRPIELRSPGQVFHIAWNPRDTNLLAAGVEDNTIRIWDVDTGRQTVTLKGDNYNGLVVAFHPGGDLLASRGLEWDAAAVGHPDGATDPEYAVGLASRAPVRSRTAAGCLHTAWEMRLEFWRSLMRPNAARWFETPDPCRVISARSRLTEPAAHLGTASTKGITIWDLPSGTPLALLPVTVGVNSHPIRSGRCDPDQLSSDPAVANLVRPFRALTIGPPQLLQWYQTTQGFSRSRDGRVVALAIYDGGGLSVRSRAPHRLPSFSASS